MKSLRKVLKNPKAGKLTGLATLIDFKNEILLRRVELSKASGSFLKMRSTEEEFIRPEWEI